jgi:hypothetical protein
MVVLDSSALILLAKIEMLETFVLNYSGKILISGKVRQETCVEWEEETPLIERLIKSTTKLQVVRIESARLSKKLMEDFHIDAGEAEAVGLALKEKASIVATDDRNAIRACKMLGVNFTTAIAILIRAFEKNLVEKDEALIKLQKLELVARYNRAIIEDAKKRIEGGD